MGTLDVLDYKVRLDEALAPHLPAGARKLAVKEARRVIEDLAFRFALKEDRVMPEDLDYARALEAMKPPERAAEALLKRAPVYAGKRRRRMVVSLGTLAVVLLLGLAFAGLVQSEESVDLVDAWVTGSGEPLEESFTRSFMVTDDLTRLQFSASVLVLKADDDAPPRTNTITVLLLDPDGHVVLEKVFTPSNAVYMKEVVPEPRAGEWKVFVDYRDAAGSSEVNVLGVKPATEA